jgi:hypothetical protein
MRIRTLAKRITVAKTKSCDNPLLQVRVFPGSDISTTVLDSSFFSGRRCVRGLLGVATS